MKVNAALASVCSGVQCLPESVRERVAGWRDNDEKVRGDRGINTAVLSGVLCRRGPRALRML